MAMLVPTQEAQETEDIPIRLNERPQRDEEKQVLEAGAYLARLKVFRTVDKPDWKVEKEAKKYPNKDVDPKQWLWAFELTEEGFEGIEMADYTSRTFGTVDSRTKATASIYAALLLGKESLDADEGMGTQQLIGRPIELWLTCNEEGTRNYISAAKCRPIKPRKAAPQRAPQASQGTKAGNRVQLDGYPQDAPEGEFWPELPPEG